MTIHAEIYTQPQEKEIEVNLSNLREANPTSNLEMDRMVEHEISHFYKAVRQKELTRSIEKETEQYFSNSYRPIKSKNEI